MDPAETDPIAIEPRAFRRLVATLRFRRWTGRNGRTPGAVEHSTAFVGERHTAIDISVAGDSELTAVMQAMMPTAEADEVPGVGRSAVQPMPDVMNVDVAVVRAS